MHAKLIALLLLFTIPVMANDIYVTQSGATLDLDITQDGQNNTVGNSTTASTVTGATTTIEHAVHNMIYEGIKSELWSFKIEE